MRLVVASVAIGVFLTASAFGQYVISAHSGVVQAVDGKAYLNDKPVELKFGKFPSIQQDQEFRTEEGRAEILLTPGVFLRLRENSSIRMISNSLTDTRVEVLTGSAMVESDSIQKDDAKDNAVTLIYKGYNIHLQKHGLYRVDTDPAFVKVYDGEAIVNGDSGRLILKSSKEAALGGALMAENFDKKSTDDLYLWSNQRSGYLAKASASSAMTLRNSGSNSSGLYSPWQWNPMFGLFTFVPNDGIAYSPFGFGFWSPYSVLDYPIGGGGYYRNGGFASRSGGPTYASSGSRGISPGSSFGAAHSNGGGGFAGGGARGGGMGGGMSSGGHAGGGGGHGR